MDSTPGRVADSAPAALTLPAELLAELKAPPGPDADLFGLPEYQQARQRFFPSENSLRWYVRRNRAGLVDCGALMLHAGRWLVDASRFDAFVREAGRQAAERQLAAA